MLDQLDIRTPALPATLLDPNLPADATIPDLRQPAAASGPELNMPAVLDQVLPPLPETNASKVFFISSACIFRLIACFLFLVSIPGGIKPGRFDDDTPSMYKVS